MAPRKIIIDTDPGIDDVLAMLLALSASADELEVLLISLTFGNTDLENCVRNTLSMFHVLEEERKWRVANGRPPGFGSLKAFPPALAVGADRPLERQVLIADYFHGRDGLGGVQTDAPHFTPTETWQDLLQSPHIAPASANFIPSATPAHLKMLELLRAHPADTITIVALGPLTNLALAAAADPAAFLRAREVVAMGGAIDVVGNITPAAEFNHYACAWSAARIYALSSPRPASTLPPAPAPAPAPSPSLPQLNLSIVPLDITCRHLMAEEAFRAVAAPLEAAGSPLAAWTSVFLAAAFVRMEEVYLAQEHGVGGDLEMHDPLCVWYLLSRMRGDVWTVVENRDIRVEATGQWTRGMCVVDRRGKRVEQDLVEELLLGDIDGWLHAGYGNRVRQVLQSPPGHEQGFAGELLQRVFGNVG